MADLTSADPGAESPQKPQPLRKLVQARDELGAHDAKVAGIDGNGNAREARQKSIEHRVGGTFEDERRSEEHTSELQSLAYLVCRLLLEKKKHHSQQHTR